MRSYALLLAAAVIGWAGPSRSDSFEDAVRATFHLPAAAQVAWPPRAELNVGSVVDPTMRVVALETNGDISRPLEDGPIEIAVPVDRLGPADAFWTWRGFLGDPTKLSVVLRLKSLEVINEGAEQTPPGFERRADPQRAKSAQGSATVVTTWRAKADLILKPGLDLGPRDWLELRRLAQSDSTETVRASSTAIALNFKDPITLAFVTNPAETSPNSPLAARGPKAWALATIASGKYQNLPTMDQPWNQTSAALVEQSLADWRPSLSQSLRPAGANGISREGVLGFIDNFVRKARQAKAALLVVYYIGHMERAGTGALSLLMGDAPEKRVTTTPVKSGVAGNLRDVMQVVEQAEAELAPRSGTLDVAVLQRHLAEAHIPYVLLVDGCLEDPNYAQARDRLGIVVDAHGGEPLYVGPGDSGSALRAQLEELRNYPTDFPYLKGKDPIVLGATPGTAAYAETDPIWQLGAPVGPIARHLSDVVARTRWSSDRPSLIALSTSLRNARKSGRRSWLEPSRGATGFPT